MGTKCSITLKDENTYYTIGCNSNGRLSWVGNKLLTKYNTFNKVKMLVEQGHIVNLTDTIEELEDVSGISTKNNCYLSVLDEYSHYRQHYLFEDGKWYFTLKNNYFFEYNVSHKNLYDVIIKDSLFEIENKKEALLKAKQRYNEELNYIKELQKNYSYMSDIEMEDIIIREDALIKELL